MKKNHYWDIGERPPRTKDLLLGFGGVNGLHGISIIQIPSVRKKLLLSFAAGALVATLILKNNEK